MQKETIADPWLERLAEEEEGLELQPIQTPMSFLELDELFKEINRKIWEAVRIKCL